MRDIHKRHNMENLPPPSSLCSPGLHTPVTTNTETQSYSKLTFEVIKAK